MIHFGRADFTPLLTALEARAATLFNEDGWALLAMLAAELLNLRALLNVFAGRLAALGVEELAAEVERLTVIGFVVPLFPLDALARLGGAW